MRQSLFATWDNPWAPPNNGSYVNVRFSISLKYYKDWTTYEMAENSLVILMPLHPPANPMPPKGRVLTKSPTSCTWFALGHMFDCTTRPVALRLDDTSMLLWRGVIPFTLEVIGHEFPIFIEIQPEHFLKYNDHTFCSTPQIGSIPICNQASQSIRSSLFMYAWYVSNVSIIFDAPCLFLHYFLSVLLYFVAFLCIFQN
jgi:hypothetical protein